MFLFNGSIFPSTTVIDWKRLYINIEIKLYKIFMGLHLHTHGIQIFGKYTLWNMYTYRKSIFNAYPQKTPYTLILQRIQNKGSRKKSYFLNGSAIYREGRGVKGLPLRKNNFFSYFFFICWKKSDFHFKVSRGGGGP